MEAIQISNQGRVPSIYRAARWAVAAIFFLNGFIYANWIARLPHIQTMFGLSNGRLGLCLLLLSVGALIAMPFSGWLIMRHGSRRQTAMSALMFCLLTPLIPFMPTSVALMALFLLMGMATGTLDVAMNAQAVLVEQKTGRPIMSSFHAIFSAGMMLGAGSSALFTKYGVSLSLHLLVIIGLALLVLSQIVPRFLSEDHAGSSPAAGSGDTGFRMPDRRLWSLGLIAFCCMMGEGAMADWSTNYLARVVKARPEIAPLGLAAFSLAMMSGRFLGDRLRQSLGDRLLLTASGLIATIGLSFALSAAHPVAVIVGFFFVGLGLAVIVPIAYSSAGNTPGLAPGLGISMVTTIGYSGFLFGPPLIGFLADWQSLRAALALLIVLFVLMTATSFLRQAKR